MNRRQMLAGALALPVAASVTRVGYPPGRRPRRATHGTQDHVAAQMVWVATGATVIISASDEPCTIRWKIVGLGSG